MINRLAQTKQAEIEDLLLRTARELAYSFDQESLSTIRTLEAMAQTSSLVNGNLKNFHASAQRTLKSQKTWQNIVLHDKNGNRIVSANHPFGTRLGAAVDRASFDLILKEKRPQVGNINQTKDSKRTTYAVRVPVLDEKSEIKYVLSAIIDVDVLQDIANHTEGMPAEFVRALVDGHGILGARTRDPEKYVGGPASPTLLELLNDGIEGLQRTTTLEGLWTYTAIVKSKVSGWSAAIAIPHDILAESVNHNTRNLLILGLLTLLISGGISLFMARNIAGSIRARSDGAAALAKGITPAMPESTILELEELRLSLLSASDLLQSRDKAKSEFLATMSHELRTPLGIVLGITDMLSNDSIPVEERTRAWNIARRNGQQLLRLINDILDFSKVEADRLIVDAIEFNLPDLVAAVVEDFSPLAAKKKLKINLVFDKSVPALVWCDPVRVRQVVSNLIDNAVKFTEKGAIEVRVQLKEEEKISITVKDTGIGLTLEQQKRLFQVFTQGDGSHTRKYGGTGLGLSLSRRIANLLQGEIDLISSAPIEGSTFEFTFKINCAVRNAAPDNGKARVQPNKSFDPQGKNVLLVEDSEDNVELIKLYLNATGLNLNIATNGQEAVTAVTTQPFDLILMDIQMPVLDGYEATRMIRDMGITTPIIALTAHGLEEHKNRALEEGFTGFLTKPVQKSELIQTMAEHF